MTDLLAELEEVTQELASLHREFAHILQQELKVKADAYFRSVSTSHAGKDREAEHGAVDYVVDRVEVRGEIEAFKERKDYLLAALRDG